MGLGRRVFRGLVVAVVVGLTAVAVGAARPASASTVGPPTWWASSSTAGDTGVTYTYRFTTTTDATVSRITMTVPPGTGGHPGVAAVSPHALAGGTVSLSGTTLTYSVSATRLAAGSQVSINISGLTNPKAPGSYTSTITTATASGPVDSGTSPAVAFTAAQPSGHASDTSTTTSGAGHQRAPTTPGSGARLGSPTWAASSSTAGDTGVTYTYRFTTTTDATVSRITMTVPPGTGGHPGVAAVSPHALAGGTVSLSQATLTYSVSATRLAAGSQVSINISGLTNPKAPGSYASTITTATASGPVDSGTTPAVAFTATPSSSSAAPAPDRPLRNPSWSVSDTVAGDAGVTYTYGFTTATTRQLASVIMTVPTGTGGTPTVGTVTPAAMAGGTVSLAGTTLTYSFTPTSIANGTAVSIQLRGLTNTATPGAYTSSITTRTTTGAAVDSGTTPAVTFTGGLTLTAPDSLTWAASLSGANLDVVDAVSADQQLTVNDTRGTGAGWNVTVSATTFTTGAVTLPNTGTFVVTGSLTSPSAATAPTAACAPSCTLPGNSVGYPVAVTTAPSSPTSVRIYNAAVGTGQGTITLGGHSAANPLGWWVHVPASAVAGTYQSTVTLAVNSGP